jgi:hypothetical protein
VFALRSSNSSIDSTTGSDGGTSSSSACRRMGVSTLRDAGPSNAAECRSSIAATTPASLSAGIARGPLSPFTMTVCPGSRLVACPNTGALSNGNPLIRDPGEDLGSGGASRPRGFARGAEGACGGQAIVKGLPGGGVQATTVMLGDSAVAALFQARLPIVSE